MIGEIIQEAIGKKISKVIAYDPVGYDIGFTLVFDDGMQIGFSPYDLIDKMRNTNRIDIKEIDI